MERVTRADRRKLYRQLFSDLQGFDKAYRRRAYDAAVRICAAYERQRKPDVARIVRGELERANLTEDMESVVLRAMAHGYGVDPSVTVNNDIIHKEVESRVWTGDGMTLSQRLYKDLETTRANVVTAITASTRNCDAVIATARKLYDGYGHPSVLPQAELPKYLARVEREAHVALSGEDLAAFKKGLDIAKRQVAGLKPSTPLKAAYRQMLDAAVSGKPKAISKAVHVALEEKSRYHAMRIARTEAARAYYDGFRARNDKDRDVVAYKWELSGAHPKPDICDDLADADAYGLGPGVYPKDKFPELPAHPHCLCAISEVYAEDLKKDGESPQPNSPDTPSDMRKTDAERNMQELSERTAMWREDARKIANELVMRENVDRKIREAIEKGVQSEKDAVKLGKMLYNEIKDSVMKWSERLTKEATDMLNKGFWKHDKQGKLVPDIRALSALSSYIRESPNEVLMEMLRRYRDIGGVEPVYSPLAISEAGAVELVNLAARFLPDDWVRKVLVSDAQRGVYFSTEFALDGRAYADDQNKVGNKINIAYLTKDSLNAAIHELGHLFEARIKSIGHSGAEFYFRRTMDGKPENQLVRLNTLLPNSGYRNDELTRKDHFVHPYMGRWYNTVIHTEIISMGIPAIFTNEFDIWNKDPEYVQLILGLLLGAK